MSEHFVIQTMTRRQLDIAIEWAALEGWNPGLCDAGIFFAADPNGFFIGLLDDEPVSAISAVKYGASFGFVGLYIVKPEYRGRGFGIQTWNAGVKYLDGRVMGLDGVVEQQHNYRKSGFEFAHNNIRFAGLAGQAGLNAIESIDVNTEATIVEAQNLSFDLLQRYDQKFFPDDRSSFLVNWLGQRSSFAIAALRDNQVAGYGVIRACREGHKIGPLFADDSLVAERLFCELKSRVASVDSVFLDVPANNPQAVALAKKYEMNQVFETARMYSGHTPKLPIDRTFGITTFELG